ncbi:MAG TPA: phage terminase large subunit [Pyrinomonadaceae bacterium]|nr:phage terminase large subunit [Pyrinomonadaceae bacterium]
MNEERELQRPHDDFSKWLKADNSKLNWDAKHLRHIITKLDEVSLGICKRLMIFLPPRHGKSELVTMRYVAWRIAVDPTLNVIVGSYNQKLANGFSRRIKQIVGEFRTIAADRRAIDEWETTERGGVKAVGIGAGITGFGGKLVVIDDPVKSRSHAESIVRREGLWDWFNDDIYTRLEPDATVIIIQTRWHEDDLAGRLLGREHENGDQWEVIDLPALARETDALGRKPGEALWPDRFSVDRLQKIKRQLGSYSFASLYQQEPMPRSGGMFKREWFSRIVAAAPFGLRWARGYDLAVSTKDSADYTASFRCAFGPDGTLYIADGFRDRIEYPEQRRYIVERLVRERNTEHGVESALHGSAIVQDLTNNVRTRGRPIRSVRVDNDKWTRALAWSPLAEAGKIALVRGSWNDEFIAEAAAFPRGRHDDQIDAVSLAVQMLSAKTKAMTSFR